MDKRVLYFSQFILSIVFMSSSGALGRFIDLPVPVIIWSRCILAAVALFSVLKITKQSVSLKSKSDFFTILVTALLLGSHWVTYFLALKYSSVAIGMLSMFTYPVMTAVIEPLLFGSKFDIRSVLLALFSFSGVVFLVPEFSIGNQVTIGVLFGLFSALTYAIRNILSKRIVSGYSGLTVMMYQAMLIAIMLTPSIFFMGDNDFVALEMNGWIAVVLLGIYTTAVGHSLLVNSFAHFPVITLSTISCLTPLFGIIQGYLFLGEKPTHQVMIGGVIILIAAVLESLRLLKRTN
ncbi:DMT family transporter [Reichenbachiella versicolor]|uniref:DMT family transporter n=1 Tax=Reichenbachiella versicolor TaxID=1821036 RepID=UPI000D6DD0C7|nr:DMT family transporter [Reichenbachiella versicolor]